MFAPAPFTVTTLDGSGQVIHHQLMAASRTAAMNTAVEHSGVGARAIRCFRELDW